MRSFLFSRRRQILPRLKQTGNDADDDDDDSRTLPQSGYVVQVGNETIQTTKKRSEEDIALVVFCCLSVRVSPILVLLDDDLVSVLEDEEEDTPASTQAFFV